MVWLPSTDIRGFCWLGIAGGWFGFSWFPGGWWECWLCPPVRLPSAVELLPLQPWGLAGLGERLPVGMLVADGGTVGPLAKWALLRMELRVTIWVVGVWVGVVTKWGIGLPFWGFGC